MNENLQAVLNSMTVSMYVRSEFIGVDGDGIDMYTSIPTVSRKSSLEDFVKMTAEVVIPDNIDINTCDCGTVIDIVDPNAYIWIDRVFRSVTINGNDIDENSIYSLIAVARDENMTYGYHGHIGEAWENDLFAYHKYQYVDTSVMLRALEDKKSYPFEGFEVFVVKSTAKHIICTVRMRDDICYTVDCESKRFCRVVYTTPECSKEMQELPAGVARAIVTVINAR